MPVFYFNVRSGDAVSKDEIGLELDDMDSVRLEAKKGAKSMLKEAIDREEIVDGNRFEVTDETGEAVLTYRFRDALKLK